MIIKYIRNLIPLFLFIISLVPSFGQPTTVVRRKDQLPSTTVYKDQSNTYTTGVQRFPSNQSGTARGFAQDLAGFTGAPTSGSHTAGEFHVDSSGSVYMCSVSGSPGTWVLVGPGAASSILLGINQGSTDASTTAQFNAGENVTLTKSFAGGTTNITISSTDVDNNAIINGEGRISQRDTSFANVVNNQYTVDRFIYRKSSAMVHTVSNTSTVPTFAQAGRRVQSSILLDCTTQSTTTIASGEFITFDQHIRGERWRPLDQKPLVLQFWVYATKTGVYCATLRNGGAGTADRSCVKEFTVHVANTWEFKTVNFPPSPTGGSWNYTTGIGATLGFTLLAGSSFQTTAGQWQTGNFCSTSNQVNAVDSTNNNFIVTGIKLEPGYVHTPYIEQSYDDLLFECKRYYEELGGVVANEMFGSGETATNTNHKIQIFWVVDKVKVPSSITISSASHFTVQNGGGFATATALSFSNNTRRNTFVDVSTSALGTQGDGSILHANTTSARIYINAEL